jgi:hypothetical protein
MNNLMSKISMSVILSASAFYGGCAQIAQSVDESLNKNGPGIVAAAASAGYGIRAQNASAMGDVRGAQINQALSDTTGYMAQTEQQKIAAEAGRSQILIVNPPSVTTQSYDIDKDPDYSRYAVVPSPTDKNVVLVKYVNVRNGIQVVREVRTK